MNAPTTQQWLRTALHRIRTGSARRTLYLATWTVHRGRRAWHRTADWLAQGSGTGWLLRLAVLLAAAAVLRKAGTALACSLYTRIEGGGAPWIPAGAAAWWIVSAYRAGRDGWTPKRPAIPTPAEAGPHQEQEQDAAAQEQPAPAAEQPAAPALRPVALVAAVRDIGTPHAQLKPLAEHLGVSTDAVRDTAAALGWPVKDVRQTGRSASAGLRWDECPSPALADPSPSVVAAGQPTDDNDDDSAWTAVPDDHNPVRTHVRWHTP
ncbi:hypothetical protein SZN_09326 [Streptomyces zinciresistens K42]|uniref:Uncharacterized protein n=1 Tax=Streptomyces zinciresistens K42 TaxID=700597 RepID=G2G8P7_9ACTN|nr:hypothetical protein [Streptomyces zinciresistens]EGX60112.1 hypothetical protein SZN_09326 [Streptomyces zinciresistens K42]